MGENRSHQVRELQEKASRALNTPTFQPTLNETLILSVLQHGHFWDWNRWFVFQAEIATRFTIEHIIWKWPFDNQRLLDPMLGLKYGFQTDPTLQRRNLAVESMTLQNLLLQAATLEPYHPVHKVVLDGNWLTVELPTITETCTFLLTDMDQPIVLWSQQVYSCLSELSH